VAPRVSQLIDEPTLMKAKNKAGFVAVFFVVLGGFTGAEAQPTIENKSYDVVDLGTLGGSSSTANGITAQGTNAAGMIVGSSTTSDNAEHAFLYVEGQMFDLNDLCDLSQSDFRVLTVAKTINDSCLIVGEGITNNGDKHAFLLTPVAVGGGQWSYACCQWIWTEEGGGWCWESGCGCYRWHGPPGRHRPPPREPPPCWWFPLPCPPPCHRPRPTPTPTPTPPGRRPTPTPTRTPPGRRPTPTPTLPPPVRRTPTPTPTQPPGILRIPSNVQPTPTRHHRPRNNNNNEKPTRTPRERPRRHATPRPRRTVTSRTHETKLKKVPSERRVRKKAAPTPTPRPRLIR
jgi:probable HAF family extracellular repeat protein